MPLCKIRTSKLSYREIRLIHGFPGFLVVAFMKVLRCDLAHAGRYVMPCLWEDMRVAPETLSADALSEIAAPRLALASTEGAWECHYFQRPHHVPMIADSGGAFYFAPGVNFSLMHVYARAVTGLVVSHTFVGSFLGNGHTVSTTNVRNGFDLVPGSQCDVVRGSTKDLITEHRNKIAEVGDLMIFNVFSELTQAYDRKEKLQADWDMERGVFVPITTDAEL